MSSLVGQHQVTTFTSPVNGQTPIDANVVRSNDNTLKTAYDAHDNDPTIHVQDSLASARPSAGTAGRKWLDSDTLRVYFDNGSVWSEIAYVPSGGGTVTGPILLPDGTVAAPALAFANDPDCGLYRIGTNNIGVAIGGSKLLDLAAGVVAIVGVLTATSSITASGGFAGDGSAITGLNASVLASGTVPSARVSGSYTGITGVGTIAAGTWQGTAIADTYLATIATAGKVSNSATTATSANTASAIVARDGSGNFTAGTITAALTGVASSATKLQTARTINGVSFDGTANIIVSAATVGTLTFGTYLQAGDASFSGSAATISTNATSAATASTLVARDSSAGIAIAALIATTGAFSSNVTVGGTLGVTGTTAHTGNVGIGGAANAAIGLLMTSTGFTGASQYALNIQPSFSSAATTFGRGIYTALNTAASSFTMPNMASIYIDSPGLGGGSTVTNMYGLYIADQAGGATLNYALYTNAGLVRFGGAVTMASTLAVSSTLTGGTYNGQTISSAASLTGTLATASDVILGGTSPLARLHVRGSGTSSQVSASVLIENTSSGTFGADITGSGGSSRLRLLYGGGPGTGTNSLTEAMSLQLEGASAGQITLAKLLTITTGGLTVSAGTTAVQALTATTGSFSSTLGVTGIASFSEAIALAANGTGAAGRIYKSATIGTVIWGAAGSVNDFTLTNSAGGTVFGVPTGTTTAAFSGAITTTSTTDSTSTTTGSIQTSGGLGVVKSVVVGGTVTAAKYKGSGTPGISTSAGAGTSPTATLATNSNDAFGAVNFTAGTSPNGNNAMVTVTYSAAYSTAPFPTITEASSGAVVGGIYLFSYDVNGFTISMTNPSSGIIANYSYHIGQ